MKNSPTSNQHQTDLGSASSTAAGLAAPATSLVLISHRLCPYVQRVAITLAEKGLAFERVDVDLANKPAWFTAVSPLGKTPVLLSNGEAIFESAVICEYLDDTLLPRLHPAAPLARAKHRAWIEFSSSLLALIGKFYSAADEAALLQCASDIRTRLQQLEAVLQDGPFFDQQFSLVDAAFAPVFRYFDLFDDIADLGIWAGLPKICRWRENLAARASVRQAVSPHYRQQLADFLAVRHSALALRAQRGGQRALLAS